LPKVHLCKRTYCGYAREREKYSGLREALSEASKSPTLHFGITDFLKNHSPGQRSISLAGKSENYFEFDLAGRNLSHKTGSARRVMARSGSANRAYLLHPMRNNFSAVLIAAIRDQSTQIRRDSLRFSFSNGI
jgi:hypothetical protein